MCQNSICYLFELFASKKILGIKMYAAFYSCLTQKGSPLNSRGYAEAHLRFIDVSRRGADPERCRRSMLLGDPFRVVLSLPHRQFRRFSEPTATER